MLDSQSDDDLLAVQCHLSSLSHYADLLMQDDASAHLDAVLVSGMIATCVEAARARLLHLIAHLRRS